LLSSTSRTILPSSACCNRYRYPGSLLAYVVAHFPPARFHSFQRLLTSLSHTFIRALSLYLEAK
jgi:hypothetical protein